MVDDGCTGIAVFNAEFPIEVQLEEHKLIVVYASRAGDKIKAVKILRRYDVPEIPDLKFITEADHFHTTSNCFQNQFEQLKRRLGADCEDDN